MRIENITFNYELLQQQLGSVGISVSGGKISRWVWQGNIEATCNPDQEAVVQAIVARHQPQERTVKQQEVEAQEQRLATLREQAAATSLDMDSDLSNVVQLRQMVALLMKKVAWLEAELQELQPPRPPLG